MMHRLDTDAPDSPAILQHVRNHGLYTFTDYILRLIHVPRGRTLKALEYFGRVLDAQERKVRTFLLILRNAPSSNTTYSCFPFFFWVVWTDRRTEHHHGKRPTDWTARLWLPTSNKVGWLRLGNLTPRHLCNFIYYTCGMRLHTAKTIRRILSRKGYDRFFSWRCWWCIKHSTPFAWWRYQRSAPIVRMLSFVRIENTRCKSNSTRRTGSLENVHRSNGASALILLSFSTHCI